MWNLRRVFPPQVSEKNMSLLPNSRPVYKYLSVLGGVGEEGHYWQFSSSLDEKSRVKWWSFGGWTS